LPPSSQGYIQKAALMFRSSFPGPLLWLIGVAQLVGLVAPAHAQVPSPAQIEMFQNLPPDQQQSILESFGRGDSGGLSSGAAGGRF
jgi:hypothetical protein